MLRPIVASLALLLTLTACGDSDPSLKPDPDGKPSSNSSATPTTPNETSSPTPSTPPDPDAKWAKEKTAWERKLKGKQGPYALRLARNEGWKGDLATFKDSTLTTCLALAKYRDGEYKAETAWALILNAMTFGQTDLFGEEKIKVVSYQVGAACPGLLEASQESIAKLMRDAGFQ